MSVGDELVVPFTASFEGSIPDGYQFERISIGIPFYEENAIGIVLAPTGIDDPLAAVKEMWATDVGRLGSDSLAVSTSER